MCEFKYNPSDPHNEMKCTDSIWDNDEWWNEDSYQESVFIDSQKITFDKDNKKVNFRLDIVKRFHTPIGH